MLRGMADGTPEDRSRPRRLKRLAVVSDTVLDLNLNGGGGGGLGSLTFALYADLPNTITSSGGIVSAWGVATTAVGSPLLITDTVSGNMAIRFDVGSSLSIPVGLSSFLSTSASTVIMAFRVRNFTGAGLPRIVDSSSNGTTPGYQIRLRENGTGGTDIRRIQVGVTDGVTFHRQMPDSDARCNTYNPLRWHVALITFDAGESAMYIDDDFCFDTTFTPITFSQSAPGALVLGNAQIDVQFLGAGPKMALATARSLARTVSARYGIQRVSQVAGSSPNSPNYSAFPSACLKPDNATILTSVYVAADGAAPLDATELLFTSSDLGNTWNTGPVVPTPTGFKLTGFLPLTLANGHMVAGITCSQNGTSNQFVFWSVSTDGGTTWSTPTQISFAGDTFNISASRPFLVGTTIYWAIYYSTASLGAHWSCRLISSTNEGTSWTTVGTIADGSVGPHQWAEAQIIPGGVSNSVSGLPTNAWLALVRENLTNNMYEVTSTNSGATWGTPTQVIVNASSTGETLTQDSDTGEIVWCGRATGYQDAGFIYRRLTNTPTWSSVTTAGGAVGTDCAFYAFNYASLVKTAAQTYTYIGGREQSLHVADTFARPGVKIWEVSGKMPGDATPHTATLAGGATQPITAVGAGNFTYPGTFPSGGGVNSGGLYTAGNTAATDTINVTDLNGYVVRTLSYTSTGGGSWSPPVAPEWWIDPSVPGNVTASGGIASALKDLSANNVGITCVNSLGYGSTTINSLNTLHQTGISLVQSTLAHTLSNWTWFFVLKLLSGATSGYQSIATFGAFNPALYFHGGVADLYFGADHAFTDITNGVGDTLVLAFAAATNQVTCYRNGVASSSNPITVSIPTVPTAIALLSESSSGSSSPGLFDVGESILFPSVLNSTDLGTVFTHLNGKWGHSP